MAKKRDLGKWSLICGIGSIVAPFLFVPLSFYIALTLGLFFVFHRWFLFVILSSLGFLIAVGLGITGIILYVRSYKKRKSGFITSIVGIVLTILYVVTIILFVLGTTRTPWTPSSNINPTAEINQYLLEELNSNATPLQKMSFPTSKVTAEIAETQFLGVGVRNVESTDLSFRIKINLFSFQENGQVINVNKELTSNENDDQIGMFSWDHKTKVLKPKETGAYSILYNAGEKEGAYLIKILIEKENGDIYAEKSFFVKVIV